MTPDVSIVTATPQDIPEISALAATIWRACYPGIITPAQIEFMLDWMYSPAQLRADMSDGVTYHRLLIAAAPAGFAAWGPTEIAGICKIHKLYLLPAHHGQGLGSHLLKHVLASARAGGFRHVTLNVNKRNAKAIASYQRNGFAVEAEVCVDIGGGYVMDDFVMGKPL